MKNREVSPSRVYEILFEKLGPQGWWPVTRGNGSRPAYFRREYSRKSPKEKFEICLGAILTQNTSWKNVEKALENLNGAGAVSPERIHSLSIRKLAMLIRPSGYYNQKADRLKGFASHVLGIYGGKLELMLDRGGSALRKELLSIRGIGPETADSIMLYAAGKRAFIADAYTIRLGRRLGWFGRDADYDKAKGYITSDLPRSLKVYNEFHALIVAVGKDHCKKKPVCAGCALKDICRHGKRR